MTQACAWDRAIASRLLAGDDTALAAAYDQYGSLVHGIATHLIGPERANDVTQEVFISLWERPERFDPDRGALRTFLAVLARRRAIDELRSSSRREAREHRSRNQVPETVPNVEEAALAVIAAERIRVALERLPAEQRQAIELAYFEGLTFKEVARATGSPEGTTKSRLRLGLGRLARDLADQADRGEPTWI